MAAHSSCVPRSGLRVPGGALRSVFHVLAMVITTAVMLSLGICGDMAFALKVMCFWTMALTLNVKLCCFGKWVHGVRFEQVVFPRTLTLCAVSLS